MRGRRRYDLEVIRVSSILPSLGVRATSFAAKVMHEKRKRQNSTVNSMKDELVISARRFEHLSLQLSNMLVVLCQEMW